MSTSENLTSKNKSSFLRNSRFDLFHEGKDVEALLRLVASIKEETPSNLSTLHVVATKLKSKMSKIIPRIIRPVRLELKEEDIGPLAPYIKDFMELELSTQRVYFAIFGDLFVFLARLREYIEQKEPDDNYDFLQSLNLSPELREHLRDLDRATRDMSLDIFEEWNEDALFFLECLLVEIVMDLLRIEIKFETTLEYTTFRNPMVLFFTL